MNLHQRAPREVRVGHLQVHVMGLHVGVLLFMFLELLLFLLEIHLAQIFHSHCRADNAHHTERIGTGVP